MSMLYLIYTLDYFSIRWRLLLDAPAINSAVDCAWSMYRSNDASRRSSVYLNRLIVDLISFSDCEI